jgi:hypothetical protein
MTIDAAKNTRIIPFVFFSRSEFLWSIFAKIPRQMGCAGGHFWADGVVKRLIKE